MNFFDSAAVIFHDVVVLIEVMLTILVLSLFGIALLPADNPLKRILSAASLRIAATLSLGVAALPAQAIPGVDVAYDLAAPLLTLYLAVTFIREVITILRESHRAPPVHNRQPSGGHPTIDVEVLSQRSNPPRLPGARARNADHTPDTRN